MMIGVNDDEARAAGINASGTVCGARSIGSKGDPVNPTSAFIWSAKDGFTDLGLMNRQSTMATDINDAGITLGVMIDGGSFRWNGSEFHPLPAVLGHSPFGRRLKADGTVVGVVSLSPPPPPIPTRAFSEKEGVVSVFPPFAGSNNSTAVDRTSDGQILGSCVVSGEAIPTLWRNQVPICLNDLIIGSVPINAQQPIGASDNGLLLVPSGSRACVLRGIVAVGDLNNDCLVGVPDLIGVIMEWGKPRSPADFSGDGVVNEQDLLVVISNWSA